MVVLSKRLAQVADFVPPGAVVADIGTDHGFLAINLIKTGRASRVVAGELKPGPYRSALAAVRSRGLEKQIDVRLGNGLKILAPGEVDVIVLAGMGGHAVCDILKAGKLVLAPLKRLIIQPMRNVVLVRQWLVNHGWRLVDEELVKEDKHYYIILAAEPGQETAVDQFYLEIGPRLLEKRSPIVYDYLTKRYKDLVAVRQHLKNSTSYKSRVKVAAVDRETELIKEVLKHW